jgi:hypothetical protein
MIILDHGCGNNKMKGAIGLDSVKTNDVDIIAVIELPHVRSIDAFMYPTHKHFFTIKTIDYFTEDSAIKYYSSARFKILRKELKFKPKWLQWLFNLLPEFAERLPGIVPVKANIYWVIEKSAANGDI